MALGYITASWVLRLDRIVVARFEGPRFAVPSKVLSAPTILYPGLDWERIDLRGTLLRLGYREEPWGGDLAPGKFRWSGDRLRIHLRAFDHPSRPEPARDIVLRLAHSEIEEIRELPRGNEVGAVLLEPELVGAYYGPDREQRDLVKIGDVPRHLIDAILAVEDRRFETHHGVDLRRIGGAFLANLRAGSIQQGGSTLTQQLVKNFFLTPEKTLTRKAKEAVMAILVEARYDKQAILESYLNEIYFGQRGATSIHGVGEAAHLYFGKRPADLSVSESALLAAIIQSPNRISPHRDPQRGIERRNLVLALMREQGRIDAATYEWEKKEPLRVAAVTPEAGQDRYFLDVLRRQLPEAYDRRMLAVEGLRIYSTLDVRMQHLAAKALREGLDRIEARYPLLHSDDSTEPLQGCLVALRPQTGEILALVGGRNYGRSQFDRCTQARRPVGSVFKPFVYIAALEPTGGPGSSGQPIITLASFLDDGPLEVKTPSGLWQPENYDHEFHGLVSVREALERSLNVAAARLGQRVGVDRIADVARRLGVTSPLPEVPSLALGAADLSPLEIARAYATLANGGVRPSPHTFEDVVSTDGQTLARRNLEFRRVLGSGTAYLITSLLEGVVERGTAVRVRNSGLVGPIAGKTGTTDDEHDLWFVGFTPELVAVVWIGFDKPRSIGVPSSQAALPIWTRFIKDSLGTRIRGAFPKPSQVRQIEIDPRSGARALAGCPVRRTEYFLPGTEPVEVCPGGRKARYETGDGVRDSAAEALRDLL